MSCGYTKLPSVNAEFESRFQALENRYVRSTRFEEISSGTSGAITITGSQQIVLDDFGGGTDAVITTIEDGRPTFENATDSAGVIIATTLDAVGNWVLTGTPSSYPIAIVYRVRERFIDFDGTSSNLVGEYDVEDHYVRASGTDISPGSLIEKVVGTTGTVDVDLVNQGGNEQVKISISDDLLNSQVGLILFELDCDASVFVGSVVVFHSDGIIYNALADTIDTSNIIGVVTNKSSSTKCDVRVNGVTEELYTGLDVTKQYYLSDVNAGKLTTTVPTDSGHVVVNVGQPMTSKKLVVDRKIVAIRA